MTYHENPVDIPVGTDVAITYDTGNTYTGTVTEPKMMTDTSGRKRSIVINGGLVTVLGDAKDDLINQLQEKNARLVDILDRQKRDRDHAEITLADFKRETSDLLVSIAENNLGHDVEDHIEDWHNELGLEPPKAEPIDVEVMVKVTARLTPTSRAALRDVGLGSFLADSVVGLDLIDFDADSFEVDLDGINVEVEDWNVTH